MSLADLSDSWTYWGPLLALLAIGAWLLRAKPFDFSFLVLLVCAQYAVHAVLALGPTDPIAIFCVLFVAVLLAAGQQRSRVQLVVVPRRIAFSERLTQRWINVARGYLLVYYCARLALYPFFSGELMLDERLGAQQENGLIYVAGLAVTPAIAAVIHATMRPAGGGRARLVDKLLLALVAVGMLGSGSKAGLAFLVFTFVGVASYLGERLLKYRLAVGGALLAIAATAYALTLFFPGLDLSDIGSLMLYRVAANTDSLEYLVEIGQQPSAYPFAGIGALFPMLFKRLGYAFEYPAGVWLHGMRFDNWDGYGPNSGIVMDYFGNLGWWGLLAALLIGVYMRVCRANPSVVMCSFLSIAFVIVTDVTLFNIAWGFWVLVLGALLLLERLQGRAAAPAAGRTSTLACP